MSEYFIICVISCFMGMAIILLYVQGRFVELYLILSAIGVG